MTYNIYTGPKKPIVKTYAADNYPENLQTKATMARKGYHLTEKVIIPNEVVYFIRKWYFENIY